MPGDHGRVVPLVDHLAVTRDFFNAPVQRENFCYAALCGGLIG